MNEELLHFVWQCQEFDKQDLQTCDHQPLVVLHPGILNRNEGPDFSQGRVRIGAVEWHGSIEIHIRSSDWRRHSHNDHPAYEQVVLHVVWQDDQPVILKSGEALPTLELKDRVNHELLFKYQKLLGKKTRIPCHGSVSQVPEVVRRSMVDAVLIERMQAKSKAFLMCLEGAGGNWDLATYEFLVANFGFKTNQAGFTELSHRLPLAQLVRMESILQVEALIFGTAGMLALSRKDSYHENLRSEYSYLKAKLQLSDSEINAAIWKFLRLRPSNFPSLRLAQLAALLHRKLRLFSLFKETEMATDLVDTLHAQPSSYWRHHYDFGLNTNLELGGLGRASRENLVINVVLPVLFGYAARMDLSQVQVRALGLLEGLTPENNRITRLWEDLGFNVESAFDSQGLIGLFNNYCVNKRCLSCKIGVSLLKNDGVPGLNS